MHASPLVKGFLPLLFRMLRKRSLQEQSFGHQQCFVLGVVLFVAVLHFVFVFMVVCPRLWRLDAVLVLTVYHVLFTNFVVAFYQCIVVDPGTIPLHWGFQVGQQSLRRRYCKVCNIWKPERSHHCSACKRCVLNMDHHCPWVMNCIGFYNRKFFLQLLLYGYAGLCLQVLASLPELLERFRIVVVEFDDPKFSFAFVASSAFLALDVIVVLSFVVLLTNFIRFHLRLSLENSTTIENLQRETGVPSIYDLGWRRNVEQILGANPWLWWLPLHTKQSRPVGDGVRWRVHYAHAIDEDTDEETRRTPPLLRFEQPPPPLALW